MKLDIRLFGATDGGVSKVEIDKNNGLQINSIGVTISTSETLPPS